MVVKADIVMAQEKEREQEKDQYLDEFFNFTAVLRGHVKHLEEVKEYIIKTYVDTGKLKIIRPTYDKRQLYILKEEEWKEYQRLKKRERD